jgi:hypothetical protein
MEVGPTYKFYFTDLHVVVVYYIKHLQQVSVKKTRLGGVRPPHGFLLRRRNLLRAYKTLNLGFTGDEFF